MNMKGHIDVFVPRSFLNIDEPTLSPSAHALWGQGEAAFATLSLAKHPHGEVLFREAPPWSKPPYAEHIVPVLWGTPIGVGHAADMNQRRNVDFVHYKWLRN